MAIKYDKLFRILEERGETSYTLTKKNRVIGQATLTRLQEGGTVDTKTIGALCEYLNCQPGDLLEWVRDTESCDNNE